MIDLTTLSEEEKAVILAKRAYKRAWNAKNKDKVKAINDRFYKKQAEKLASKAQKKPSERYQHSDGKAGFNACI